MPSNVPIVKRDDSIGAGPRRRQQILRAAYALIVKHGQVTVQMVADEVNVTDAAVFYHFRTKELLFVELMRYMDQGFEHSRDDLDEIDRAVLAMREMQATPNLLTFFLDLAARAADETHPAHDYFVRRYAEVERRLVQDATARLPNHSPREVHDKVNIFLAAIDGFQRRWLVQRNFDMAESGHIAVVSLFGPAPALEAALKEAAARPVLPLVG